MFKYMGTYVCVRSTHFFLLGGLIGMSVCPSHAHVPVLERQVSVFWNDFEVHVQAPVSMTESYAEARSSFFSSLFPSL